MIILDGNSLTLEGLYKISHYLDKVSISATALKKAEGSYKNLLHIVEGESPVYGLNTGFGIFADQVISNDESKKLAFKS